MKPEQLAKEIGWGWREIYQKETGLTQRGRPIGASDWLAYKMACAALHARKYGWKPGRVFEWRL